MQYPRPPQRPEASRLPPGSVRQYVVRGERTSPVRALLARVQRPKPPHR
jgi:hypothetical protein